MPGSLKAIACSPGAAPRLRIEQIQAETVTRSKLVLLDGQVLRNAEVTERVMTLCRENNVPLAVDIASTDIARTFSNTVLEMIVQNMCILFMNSDEALALAMALEQSVPGDRGIQIADDFVDSIFSFFARVATPFPCIIEKRGELGARAWSGGNRYEAGTVPAPVILDDTGAGDTFAGAFLHAFIRNQDISRSLAFANRAAFLALRYPGSRLDREEFRLLGKECCPLPSPR
jgi:sugar/nucleoside kinase (ribokinase family)